ncbi:hypothetical protein Nepgr_002881 [Nepenthes gracilis]|uniref:Dof zinc finger protein n=1 Tax=Nepenthes gracilis TaxID=150966 RepID=A0AAD3PAE1_NEPGR|nr:hypothetical protein Nepgr_002881 [Nepenthes gracilis]
MMEIGNMLSRGGDHQGVECPRNPMAAQGRWKTNVEMAPNCPRCASSNTKFCYYNNYSLSQPRYFCKGCRRYWTKGGSLRNVPVGGGCRKSRRARSSRPPPPTSYSPYLNGVSTSSSDPFDSDKSSTNDSNRVDIDLAAVFAKFLNHNSSPHIITADDNDSDHANFVEPQRPAVDMRWNSMQELPDQVITNDNTQKEAAGIQGIPLDHVAYSSDEVVQDVFWSDASRFSCWQPIAELQEFDDQFENSTDQLLLTDSWSFSDLPPQEIFYSRPGF